MAYTVSLKQFDGPLDLLLTLIGKARIDIQEIFVSEITEQYLAYMAGVDELDMESASEFLQMAATLVEIKSRAMLPKPPRVEDEEGLTPEEALVRQLTEYKKFKEASREMQKLESEAREILTKLPEEFPLPPQEVELTGLTLEKLTRAFARVLKRLEESRSGSGPQRHIRRDTYTVGQCMARIGRMVRKGRCAFTALFEDAADRDEVITMFMAMLEMVKHSRLHISQESTYGEIYLERAEAPAAQEMEH
ncbi:MAG: segregation/condensation protein A [Eubacteriales bacterium]|nr:segregation/condensation protein A [Clostridiales bacterium]MDD6933459.1 segregation/condensation protein A [Eubacteriales bacterium]MDY2602256.1 segregation/condensation protein A [Eubacteriales bacterium]